MYPKLRGRIIEKFGSYKAFAEAIGVSTTIVSLKLTGRVTFDAPTIEKWCNALDIPISEAGLYFFDFELNAV